MARTTRPIRGWLTAAILLAGAAPALGQASWTLEVDPPLRAPGDQATVTLIARFSAGGALASARLHLELRGSAEIAWSDLEALVGPLSSAGIPGPAGIEEIMVEQFHTIVDPSNPIAIWRGTATLEATSGGSTCIRTSTPGGEILVFPDPSGVTFAQPQKVAEGSAMLVLPGPPDPTFCYADCDGSRQLDVFDFLCFQNLFAMESHRADCNGDCFVDFFDFLCFQDEFAMGCR